MYNENSIQQLAYDILRKYVLTVNQIYRYQICEIEFYVRNDNHNDQYVHCSIEQLNKYRFYFHKYKNGTFKSGTWKGLDICFGSTDDNGNKTYFGVLIRSIMNIDTHEFIEGPCKVVNKILENLNCNNTQDFFNKYNSLDNSPFDKYHISDNNIYNKKGIIRISIENDNNQLIYKSTRIGLSDLYPEFKLKLYRFCTLKNQIKKERKNFIAYV